MEKGSDDSSPVLDRRNPFFVFARHRKNERKEMDQP